MIGAGYLLRVVSRDQVRRETYTARMWLPWRRLTKTFSGITSEGFQMPDPGADDGLSPNTQALWSIVASTIA